MTGPQGEAHRLEVLRRMSVMDTAPEPAFDRVAALAARLLRARSATVSLVDADRQWWKARVGTDLCGSPRRESFCQYAIADPDDLLVVPDAAADARFRSLALAAGPPHTRFYAGAPLVVEGAAVGALCVFDPEPRHDFGEEDRATLESLAAPVAEILRLRLESAERRSLSRALEFEARKLAMAEQLAGVGHWSVEDGGAVAWSDQVYRIHGVDPRTFDPRLDDALAFYGTDDRERVSAFVARARETGEGFAFKARLTRRSDGAVRTVLSKAERRASDGEAPAMLFGVFQDVTEEEGLLDQVRTDRERYRLLTQNATDVIATYDLDGVLTFVSPSIERLAGVPAERLIGRRTWEIIHPDDHGRVAREFADFLRGEDETARIEYRMLSAGGGAPLWVEAHPSRIRDASGRVTGFQDVVRDVTGRKQLERQLEAARDDAQAAARAKSDFLANMSHELRTPLTGILGYAEVLAGEAAPGSPARRHADRIGEAGRSLLKLVDDVLDLSRIEAAGPELRSRAVRLDELAASAVDLVRAQAAAKGLRLELEAPADSAPVEVDPDRLRQVLLNLLSNAVKFTEAGEVRLRLTARGAGPGFVDAALAVSDSGVGVAPDRLDTIFGRFEQADGSIRRRYGGTGLGLAISRALVAAMGGRLTAVSGEGRGSVFTVELRLPVASALPDAGPPAGDPGRRAGLRGLQVLVAEDVAMNRDLITLFLKPAGVRLTMARDGAEAVAAAAARRFDVVLMDMQMPGMDGLEAARRIRAGAGPNRDTPILALTANVLSDEVARCREAGMNGHVGKPFDAARLQGALAAARRPAPACA